MWAWFSQNKKFPFEIKNGLCFTCIWFRQMSFLKIQFFMGISLFLIKWKIPILNTVLSACFTFISFYTSIQGFKNVWKFILFGEIISILISVGCTNLIFFMYACFQLFTTGYLKFGKLQVFILSIFDSSVLFYNLMVRDNSLK